MGRVERIQRTGESALLYIRGYRTGRSLRKSDSIAVNGVCLTVISRRKSVFTLQAVEETLRKTNLGAVSAGDRVNLERPVMVGNRFGGHFVLGHVDAVGRVLRLHKRQRSWFIWISIPPGFRKFLIPVGSVAVNGVSLTVAALSKSQFAVSVIPYTWNVTTFKHLKEGDRVNIEFDMLGKYVLNASKGGSS
ncbi:MAG: riboflavin synthase [Ignavibacteriales bacterium]|nr:riboflavin synthase [Ignavibacteriales bacterium]